MQRLALGHLIETCGPLEGRFPKFHPEVMRAEVVCCTGIHFKNVVLILNLNLLFECWNCIDTVHHFYLTFGDGLQRLGTFSLLETCTFNMSQFMTEVADACLERTDL